MLSGVLADVPHRLNAIFKDVTPAHVQAKLASGSKRFQIYSGQFEKTQEGYYLPKVDPRFEEITSIADYNISKNASKVEHLHFFKNPGFEARSNPEFLFLEPNRSQDYSLGRFMFFLSSAVTPVNAYGKDFSKKLIKTTALMMDMIASDSQMRSISMKAYYENPTLTTHQMTRVKESREMGPFAGVLEGVISFHQVVSALMAEKVPGSETGLDALRAIVRGGQSKQMGLTAEFTSRLPMGLIGPMNHGGYSFSKPLKLDPNGQLVLSETVTQTLTGLVKIMMKNKKVKSRCPMAAMLVKVGIKKNPYTPESPVAEVSALQALAESYLHIFEMVDRYEAK
jgi:hypothetical protein